MFTLAVQGKLDELQRALGSEASKKLKRETATAINATARKAKRWLAKDIVKEIKITQRDVVNSIRFTDRATPQKLSATVNQKPTDRLSLKRFGLKSTKSGISYRISKKEGRKQLRGAFVNTTLGSHAFKRRGKERLPIDKLFAVSPWGVTVINKLDQILAKREVEPELIKQIDRRIRAVNFKKLQG